MPARDGWSSLFATAFERSRNLMLLTDDRRTIVDANPAFLALVGQRRAAVVGRPTWEFVADGPLLTRKEWAGVLAAGRYTGDARMLSRDGSEPAVQWAVTVEAVSGRRLILLVATSTSRWGARARRRAHPGQEATPLTPREREVVHLVALGAAGPEIANELHISHDTVRTHARNAMEKTGARSRAHLVAKALGDGLLHE